MLPKLELPTRPKGLRFDVSAVADARFVVNAAAGTIEVFDMIGGPGVTDARVAAALRSIGPKPVTVQINSPGGDPFVGASIFNLLRAHRQPITVQITGMAASAASIVAMAGDRVETARNGQMMIHRAQGAAFGDGDTMKTVADLLEQTDAAIASTYHERTGLPIDQLQAMMQAETFMSSDDMLGLGFADALLERDAEPAPRALAASAPQTIRDFEDRLRGLGLSKAQATRAAAGAWPVLNDDAPDLSPVCVLLQTQAAELAKL